MIYILKLDIENKNTYKKVTILIDKYWHFYRDNSTTYFINSNLSIEELNNLFNKIDIDDFDEIDIIDYEKHISVMGLDAFIKIHIDELIIKGQKRTSY